MIVSVENNNPGNMRSPTGSFMTYSSPEDGMENMKRDLLLKISGNSPAMRRNFGEGYVPTLSNLITTWAPPHENDTSNYINFVAKNAGIDPEQPLSPEDVDKIIPSMIRMEGGEKASKHFGAEKQYADAGSTMNDASKYEKVTDPEILKQLEGSPQYEKVTDPSILAALNGEEKIGTGEDVAKSLASGLERGVAGTPMVLGNLLNTAVAGPQLLGRGVAEGVDSLLGIQPQPRGDLWQPFYSSEDVLKMLPDGLAPHDPQTAAGKVADLSGQILGSAATTKAMQPSPKALTADDLKLASQRAYDDAEAKGGMLMSHKTDEWIDAVKKIQPQTAKGKALAGDDELTKTVAKIENFRGQPTTLKEAMEIDEILGDSIDNEFGIGGLSAQGKKLLDVQNEFRSMLKSSSAKDIVGGKEGFDSWKTAQKLWSDQLKMRDIERIVNRASMMENPVAGLKTGFRTIAGSPSRLRAYDANQRKLIENSAKTGSIAELIKTFGSRLIPIGTLIHGGAGDALVAQAGSTAARAAATKLQLRRVGKLRDSISANSGVTPPSVQPAIDPRARPLIGGIAGSMGAELNYKKGGHVKRNLTAEFLGASKRGQ